MKIQCEVCNKAEASVFCSADEAALCHGCDRRVHHANKLASQHLRFSLLQPSSKDSPCCDICQERRAFLFCREDRAILCRECDIPIHKGNEHTQKHNRYLLTGVKLSASSFSYSPPSSSSNACNVATDSEVKSSVFGNSSSVTQDKAVPSTSTSTPSMVDEHCISQEGSVSTSSISEYLMETLPGWRVDDFLDPSSSSYGFCKMTYDQGHKGDFHHFAAEDLTCWGPCVLHQTSCLPPRLPQTVVINGLIKGSELEAESVIKFGSRWSEDDPTVPKIRPPPLKKPRQFL